MFSSVTQKSCNIYKITALIIHNLGSHMLKAIVMNTVLNLVPRVSQQFYAHQREIKPLIQWFQNLNNRNIKKAKQDILHAT